MDATYGSRYRRLYRHHWWWRAREEMILRHLAFYRPAEGFGRILDIGCGDGLFFDRLAEMGEPEGVEPEAGLVSPDGPWAGKIHVRPFDGSFRPSRGFGLVLMLDVLEHLKDDRGALGHAVSLLAEGGILVATVPAFEALWTRHDDLNHHFRRYRRPAFRRLARDAGLRLEICRYFFHWLVPLKLAVRAKESLLPAPPRPPDLPSPWLNSLFHRISTVEQALGSRLPFPLGSSLLAVGKRSSETPPGEWPGEGTESAGESP